MASEVPPSQMIQSVQTVSTTLQANQNEQHQNQGQFSQRDESLVVCNQSDQVQIDQSQHDQNQNNQHRSIQNDQIQSDQSQSQAI